MSGGIEKVAVACASCNTRLLVPANSIGKQGRCPKCQGVFTLEQLFEAEPVTDAPLNQFDAFAPATSHFQSSSDQLLATPQSNYATLTNAYATPQVTDASSYQAYPTAPQPAKGQFWDSSLLGGIALMAIAVVWFVGGLFCDVIFFYPPILFIIGIVVAIKGLVAGRITG